MDASEADDAGAQLVGLDVPAKHVLAARALPCLVGQGYGDHGKKDGIFDLYADLPDTDVVGPSSSPVLPATVTQFDMAVDDHKQYQDDVSTRLPWADIEDASDSDLVDADLAAYNFFDATAEEATADAEPQKHQMQCGPLPQIPGTTDFAEQCALGISDTLGYDYSLGPQSDIHAGLHIPQTLRTQCGPLPSDGFEATVDPGRGRSEPAVAAAAVAAAAAKSLKGEAATNVAASDPDSPGSVASVSYAAGHVDFQDFARAVLPDVFPSTGSSVQGSRSDIDSVTSAEDQSPDGELAPLPLRGTGSPGTSPGGGQGQGTQCGPLPRDLTTRTSPQQSDVGADVDLDFIGFDGCTIFDLDGDGRPATHDQGSGTQCGPLPQHMVGLDFISQTSQPQYPIGGTQFGPLPHGLDSHAFAVEASPSQDAGTRDSPCPQTSRTQCGHLPRVDDNPLEGLQTSLARLLHVSLEQRAPLDQRAAALEAYAAASRQFALAFGLDDSPAPLDTSSLHVDGTQCGPLPQQLQPQQAQYAPPAMPPEASSHSTSSRTQCGPLPRQHDPRGNDRLHLQLGPSYLQVAKDFSSTTPRTQCGPLPQTQTSFPLGKHMGIAGKGKGKGKRKGRDQKTAKPLTPGQ